MTTPENHEVGFVGLGNMGWPMARNLTKANFSLTVYDANPELVERFVDEHGARAANSPGDFNGISRVVTMLPNERIVGEVMLNWQGGIAANLASDAVLLEMSSSNPRGTAELAVKLADLGVKIVDAPVSGGVARAEDGTLSLMVGSDEEESVEKVQDILNVLGARTFRTGRSGSGHAMKALNNYIAASAYVATAEALLVGDSYGLTPDTMIEIINTSTGRSFSSEIVFGENVVPGRYATGFALGLLAKDVGIAEDLASAAELDTPLCRLVNDRWQQATESLDPTVDHSEAHKSWWQGVALSSETPSDK